LPAAISAAASFSSRSLSVETRSEGRSPSSRQYPCSARSALAWPRSLVRVADMAEEHTLGAVAATACACGPRPGLPAGTEPPAPLSWEPAFDRERKRTGPWLPASVRMVRRLGGLTSYP